jgi:hypothetical protein
MAGLWLEREHGKKTMSSPDQVSVGIVSDGMYLPEPVLTAADIAEESGLPEWVVREKRCGEGVVLY